MIDVVERASEIGFDTVRPILTDMVVCRRDLRDLCNAEACNHYGTCWSCPPGAGSYEECVARIAGKTEGLLVQTLREGVDFDDIVALDEIRALHNQRLDCLSDQLRSEYDGTLEFTTGGCDLCGTCTYPDAPCNMPERQRLALSAHGVDVAATCERCGMEYGFASGTIRFVGLVLY